MLDHLVVFFPHLLDVVDIKSCDVFLFEFMCDFVEEFSEILGLKKQNRSPLLVFFIIVFRLELVVVDSVLEFKEEGVERCMRKAEVVLVEAYWQQLVDRRVGIDNFCPESAH